MNISCPLCIALLMLPLATMASPTRKQVNHAIDPAFHRNATPWVALLVAEAADVYTTRQAFNRGCVESNPIYGRRPSWGKLIALHAGILGLAWTVRDDKVLYFPAGVFGAAAIHNAGVRCR